MKALGKPVAEKIREQIKERLSGNERVCFVIFGDDSGSKQFINMKCKFAESLGVRAVVEEHPEDLSLQDVKKIISRVVSEKYSGVVIQLPLPKNFNQQDVLDLIPAEMDIDVLSSETKKLYTQGKTEKVSPVARAVKEIFKYYNIDTNDKKILLIGRGLLVGEPIREMFEIEKIVFDQIDKNTPIEERDSLIKNADIVISGAGDSHFIKADMVKRGAILIDAGTSESEGKIVGDFDPSCEAVASFMTPVPGGVGPVTLASLFLNLSR